MKKEWERKEKEAFNERGGSQGEEKRNGAKKDREVLNGWVKMENGEWFVELETSLFQNNVFRLKKAVSSVAPI